MTFQGCPVALFVPNQRNVSEQSFSYPSKTVRKGGTLVRLPDPSQAPSGQTSDLEGALLRPCLCCTFGFQSLRACEQLNFSTSTKRPSHPAYLSLLAFVTTISPTAQEFWLLVNAQAIVFPCQGLQFAKGKESPQSQPLRNHSAPWLCLPRIILPLRSRAFQHLCHSILVFLSVMPKSRKNRAKPLSIAKID